MTKRYNLCIDEYKSFMKEGHNGEYVKYKDIEKILLHNRRHTCAVRHVISNSKLNSAPCYDIRIVQNVIFIKMLKMLKEKINNYGNEKSL